MDFLSIPSSLCLSVSRSDFWISHRISITYEFRRYFLSFHRIVCTRSFHRIIGSNFELNLWPFHCSSCGLTMRFGSVNQPAQPQIGQFIFSATANQLQFIVGLRMLLDSKLNQICWMIVRYTECHVRRDNMMKVSCYIIGNIVWHRNAPFSARAVFATIFI
jgi:hypothetical protein